MGFFKEYSTIIGLFLLVVVVIILVSTPDIVFSRGVSFIDTELSEAARSQHYVRTKMDFASAEQVRTFPKEMGAWLGFDYETSQIAETLGADVMLMRGYIRPGLYQPVFFLIMQSSDRSTFHPPPICYPILGYTIEEEGKEEVYLSDVSWAEDRGDSQLASIPVKKLVVFKESDGQIRDRRLVLYFYVKENPLNPLSSDAITMIRVSALIPIDASYDGMLGITKKFTAEVIPYLFELQPEGYQRGEITALRLARSGAVGWLTIALMLSLPLAIIVYPRLGRRRSGS